MRLQGVKLPRVTKLVSDRARAESTSMLKLVSTINKTGTTGIESNSSFPPSLYWPYCLIYKV